MTEENLAEQGPVQDVSYEKGWEAGWKECRKHLDLRIVALNAAGQTMRGAVEVQGIDKIAIINETTDIADAFNKWLLADECL